MKGEKAMQIVDAQIHLWGTGLPSNLSHRSVSGVPELCPLSRIINGSSIAGTVEGDYMVRRDG